VQKKRLENEKSEMIKKIEAEKGQIDQEKRKAEEKWVVEREQITKQIEDAANERVKNELAEQKKRLEDVKNEMMKKLEAEKEQMDEEKQKAEEELEVEREQITKQIEDAANERVKNEIAVQKKRLENEKSEMIKKIEAEKGQIDQEKRKAEEKWVVEREQITKQIEDAANERVKNELAEQKKRLEDVKNEMMKKLEAEKEQMDERKSQIENQDSIEAEDLKDTDIPLQKEQLDLTEQNVQKNGSVIGLTDAQQPDVHPILGSTLANLGYKRLHLVSSGQLGTIPVWNRNRIYRHNRARSMAADKEKSMHLGFPGVICLYEDADGKLSILDGQHRVGMMASLREKQNKEAISSNATLAKEQKIFEKVLVEVYPFQESNGKVADEHAQEVFLEINKAEPIKLLDMPGVASSADRKVITEAVTLLENQYPSMFSPSQRCKVPNVNVDNLRNSIFGANILKRHELKSSKKLFDWLLVQNGALGERYENGRESKFIREKAWKKASSNGFYLGIESSWLYK